jgi:hypothetical protein
MDQHQMTDVELDKLLKLAPTPPLPEGFAARLQARLETPESAKLIAFPAPKARTNPRLWLSAIPLAASLAAGIYLGAKGNLSDTFSSLEGSIVASADDGSVSLGIEDVEAFVNGDQS